MSDPDAFDAAPIPVLVEYLGDEDPSLRADAACALGDRLRSREIHALDPPVVDRIAELLSDEVPIVQFEAAMALAEVPDRRATQLLLLAMRHHMFRLDAIRALGTLGDPTAIEPLRKVMGRRWSAWADRLQAAAALCALGDGAGADYLAARTKSRRRAERGAALHFIGESRHPDAVRILTGVFADMTDPLRDVAARSLGFVTHPAAREALERALANAAPDLREDIEGALRLLEREAARGR